jgi:hypothetical protein
LSRKFVVDGSHNQCARLGDVWSLGRLFSFGIFLEFHR